MTLDPEMFRQKVGQFGDRWYCDPLPGCELAPATDDTWPSVSLIKKATGRDWSPVTVHRIANWLYDRRPVWDDTDTPDLIRQTLSKVSEDILDAASDRGDQVHRMFELHGNGGDPAQLELTGDAVRFRTVALRAIRELQPRVALAEVVAINRTLRYGGTFDAIWWIGEGALPWIPDLAPGYYIVDYKSRDKKHDVYLEEPWQIAAYAHADYWVIEGDDGQPLRIEPLPLQGGLLVSLTPTDYRVYPIDLELARHGFEDLVRLWWTRKGGKAGAGVGKPWPPYPPTRDEWVRDRISVVKDLGGIAALLAVWPDNVARPKLQQGPYSDADIEQLLQPLNDAERAVGAPWPPNDPGPSETGLPAEGDELDSGAVEQVRYRIDRLSSPQQEAIARARREAADAGVPFSQLRTRPTERRVFLYRALILACEHKLSEQVLRAGINYVRGVESLPTVPLGLLLGSLDAEQAQTLAALCQMAHHEQPKIPPDSAMVDLDLSKLPKKQLQDECRAAGLPVSGTKADLLERLYEGRARQ